MALPLTDEERKFLDSTDTGRKALTEEDRAFLADELPAVSPEPTNLEKTREVVGGLAQQAFDIADMPKNIATMVDAVEGVIPPGLAKAARRVSPATVGAIDMFQARNAQLPLPSELPGLAQAKEAAAPRYEGSSMPVKAGRTAMEWLGPGAFAKAPKAVTAGLSRLLPDVAPAIGAGGLSAGQQYAGSEDGTAGELIGGIAGTLAALRTGNVDNLSKAQVDMLNALRKNFDNDEQLIATVQQALDAGDVGTLTDLTGNRGLANIEAALDRTVKGQQAIGDTLDKRVERIYEDTMGITGKDVPEGALPQASAAAAARRVETADVDIEAQAGERLKQAAAAAERESEMLKREAGDAWTGAQQRQDQAAAASAQARATEARHTPPLRPDEYSRAAASRYTAAETAHKENTRKLWSAFDESGDINAAPYKLGADDYLQSLDPAEQDALLEKYSKYFKAIENFQGTVSPRALSLRVQQMKADINNAAAQGTFGWEEKKLQELVDVFEDMLVDPVNGNPAYRAAIEATKEGHDRFGPAYIKDVRKAEPEEFLSQAGLTGDRGAATSRLFNESKIPELQQDVSNRILAQAKRKKNLDEQFLIEYEAALDNLDAAGYDTRAKLVEMLDAQTAEESALAQAKAAEESAQSTSKRVGAEQDRLAKALEAQEQTIKTEQAGLQKANQGSLLAQYGKGYEQADQVVDDLLSRPDGPERLRALVDDMVELDAPQGGTAVMDSFRARVRDRMNATLFEPPKAGKAPVQAKTALKNYRTMQRRLVDAGLMDADDAKYMESVLARAETEILRTRGKASVGDVITSDTEHTNLISSMLASIFLAPLPGAYNLQLGGAVRRYFKTGLEVRPTRRNIEALTEYMTDPQAFLKGIEKLKSPKAQASFVLTKLVGASQAAEIMAANEEEE